MRIPERSPSFEILINQSSQKAAIIVKGAVDRVSLTAFEREFFDVLQASYGDISFDMRQCTYLCSGVIAIISEGVQLVENEGNWVKILASEGMVKRLLAQSGFGEYMQLGMSNSKPLL